MSDSKELRFKVLVDQVTAGQFSSTIGKMMKDLEGLTKALGQASAAFGGLLGGANVGKAPPSIAKNNPSTPFGSFATTPAALGGNGPSTRGGSLADIFLKNGQAFKGMADSSKQAMQIMTQGLKQAVDQSTKNLDQLNAKLDSVAKNYKKLAAESPSFEGSSGAAKLMQNMADIQVQATTERGNIKQLKSMGGRTILDESLKSIGGAVSAGWAAGYGSVQLLATATRSMNLVGSNIQAERAATFGSNAVALQAGDYSSIYNEYAARKDAATQSALKNIGNESIWNNVKYGKVQFGRRLNNAISNMFDANAEARENSLIADQEAMDAQRNRMADRNQVTANAGGLDPTGQQRYQMWLQGVPQSIAEGRRLGYMNNKYGAAKGALYQSQFDKLGLGSSSPYISQIAGIGGERAGKTYALQSALAQARGFGAAPQLYGLAAQGAGSNYIQSVFGATQTGDMQAAGALGVGLLNSAAQQGYGQYDQSALFGAMAMNLNKDKSGSDMLKSTQMLQGLDAINRSMTGGVDAYGKAMNVRAVQAAAPNASASAKDALLGMSLDKMSAIATGNATLDPGLIGKGITPAMVKSVMEAKLNNTIRGRTFGAGNTLEGKYAAAYQKSGMNFTDFAASHPGFSNEQAQQGLAATLLSIPGYTGNAAEGAAMFMPNLAGAGTRKLRKQGGLGDVLKYNQSEKALLETDAERKLHLAESNANSQAEYFKYIKSAPELLKLYDTATVNATTAVQNFQEAIERITSHMHKLPQTLVKEHSANQPGSTEVGHGKHRGKH